jgi:hypothetical protein
MGLRTGPTAVPTSCVVIWFSAMTSSVADSRASKHRTRAAPATLGRELEMLRGTHRCLTRRTGGGSHERRPRRLHAALEQTTVEEARIGALEEQLRAARIVDVDLMREAARAGAENVRQIAQRLRPAALGGPRLERGRDTRGCRRRGSRTARPAPRRALGKRLAMEQELVDDRVARGAY